MERPRPTVALVSVSANSQRAPPASPDRRRRRRRAGGGAGAARPRRRAARGRALLAPRRVRLPPLRRRRALRHRRHPPLRPRLAGRSGSGLPSASAASSPSTPRRAGDRARRRADPLRLPARRLRGADALGGAGRRHLLGGGRRRRVRRRGAQAAQRGSARRRLHHARGPSWGLPVYELALLASSVLAKSGIEDARLTVVTPEDAPLELFGRAVGEQMGRLLGERGIAVVAGVTRSSSRAGVCGSPPASRSRPMPSSACPASRAAASTASDRRGRLPPGRRALPRGRGRARLRRRGRHRLPGQAGRDRDARRPTPPPKRSPRRPAASSSRRRSTRCRACRRRTARSSVAT